MAIIPRSKGHSFEMGFKIRRRFGVWTYIYAYMRVSTCLEMSIHVNHIYIYTCIFIHAYARYVSLLDPQGIPTCKAPRKSDPGVPWRQCHDLGDRGPKDDRDDRGVPGTWTHKKLVTFRIQKNLKPSQNGGWISLNPILWCKPMAVLLTPISGRKKKLASQASISSSRAPFLDDGFFKRRFVLSLSVREHGIEQSAGLGEPWTIANTHPCGKPKNKKPTVT